MERMTLTHYALGGGQLHLHRRLGYRLWVPTRVYWGRKWQDALGALEQTSLAIYDWENPQIVDAV